MHKILSFLFGAVASSVATTPVLTWPGILATIIYGVLGGLAGVGANYLFHFIKKFKHAKV